MLRRARRLERVRAVFGDGLPFTGAVAGDCGRVVEAELAAGRTARPGTVDLLIAAVALRHGASLVTTDPGDSAALEGLLEVVPVEP